MELKTIINKLEGMTEKIYNTDKEELRMNLEELITYLKADYIKNGTLKNKKDVTIIRDMIKELAATRVGLAGSYIVKNTNNTHAIIDGYRMLEAITPEANKMLEPFYNKANGFNQGYDELSIQNTIEIEIDVDNLNQFIRQTKIDNPEKRKPYIIEYGDKNVIGVNPTFLKEFIQITKTNKVLVEKDPDKLTENGEYHFSRCPIHFVGEDFRGIVLPISLNEGRFESNEINYKAV